MSNRTLLEFNHDYSSFIEKHPERFLALILEQMRSARQDGVHEALRLHFGVTYHGTRHHSAPWKDHINTDGAK